MLSGREVKYNPAPALVISPSYPHQRRVLVLLPDAVSIPGLALLLGRPLSLDLPLTGSVQVHTISRLGVAMRHAVLLLAVLSAFARGVAAQDTLAIEPGERVRLTLSSGRSDVVGVLVTQDRDSLRVQPRPDAPPLAFPRAGVTSVEASLGSHGHAGTGALVGLLAGGVVGAALGSSCSDEFLCPGPGGGALLLGGTGLLFGALVGVFVRTERWEWVYPKDLGITVGKTRRGLGVGVSIGF